MSSRLNTTYVVMMSLKPKRALTLVGPNIQMDPTKDSLGQGVEHHKSKGKIGRGGDSSSNTTLVMVELMPPMSQRQEQPRGGP